MHLVLRTNIQKKKETAHIPFRLTSASAEEPGEKDKVGYINLCRLILDIEKIMCKMRTSVILSF